MEVADADISKYGIVAPSGSGIGIEGLIEKPSTSEAPSNFASIGRYVLTPDIFKTLRELGIGKYGEIQLADAIDLHAQSG